MVGHGGLAGFSVAVLCFLTGGTTAQYDGCSGPVADIANGRCDAALNVPACGFDGGDCCPCTCSDGPMHSCSDNTFKECVFPACDEEEDFCEVDWQGDGWCDTINNHAGCDWDGGDVSFFLEWLVSFLLVGRWMPQCTLARGCDAAEIRPTNAVICAESPHQDHHLCL